MAEFLVAPQCGSASFTCDHKTEVTHRGKPSYRTRLLPRAVTNSGVGVLRLPRKILKATPKS